MRIHSLAVVLAGAATLSAQTTATVTSYGTGCYDGIASFYELFPNATFDLGSSSGTNSILILPTGDGGCVVLPGSGQWYTPTSPNLGLTDDSVTGLLPLPSPHLTPAALATSIVISSNGFVWTAANTANGCCSGSSASFLSSPERYAVLWHDLNPGAGGSVHYDTDAAGAAYATWLNVPEFGAGGTSNTCQIAFLPGTGVELRWQACGNSIHVALVGWTRGNGARDPGSIDLSANPTFVTTGDSRPLAVASGRPLLNTTWSITTSNIPASTPIGAVVLSLTQHNPGLDLSSLGMPGCRQFVGLDVSLVFVAPGTSASLTVGLPNRASLLGAHFYGQSAAFAAGRNALGVIASNGLDFGIGNQ
jgi:hypothetical protein